MELLKQLSDSAVKSTDTRFLRYMYHLIPWENRMTAIVGPRGVGKTTLLLQYIKLHLSTKDALYVSAESIYFANHTLFDTAMRFSQYGGRHLFIDEVHKYKGWATELKMIYDNLPSLQVVFTGSSVLDIYKGTADLSRRVLVYQMQGLSFREFLNMRFGTDVPAYSLQQIVDHEVVLPQQIEHPLALFDEYIHHGYYPFFNDYGYEMRLGQIVSMTLETDIPQYANYSIAVSTKLKELMQVIADSVPFKPNMSTIATAVKVDRNKLPDYFDLMGRAGLISLLREPTKGVRVLGKVEKVYLDNTNLAFALTTSEPDKGNLRETFFFNQMRVNHSVFNSPVSDFLIDGRTFEIGGRNKGQKQIAEAEDGYVVKDGIETGFGNVVPLWCFGMNY
ncbi:MAG: AAA family ATPase [Prevotellaceae bacterium]|nr:AAA family ATPase [Prevotellaceae bacterium]